MEHQTNNDILRHSQTIRDINPELETQKIFGRLDAQNTSLDDVHLLVDTMSASNPHFRNNLLAFQGVNSDVIKLHLSQGKESDIGASKLQLLRNRFESLKTGFSNIQKVYNESTTLTNKGIDVVVGTFGGDTAQDSFKSSIDSQKLQVKGLISQLQNEIYNPSIDPTLKEQYLQLIEQSQKLLQIQLQDVSFSQMTDNHLNTLPDQIQPVAYALKGEVIGIAQGVEGVISGSVELLKFMVMYPFSSEYRNQFNTQAEQIFDFCVENGLDGMKDVVIGEIKKEMDRISKLPRNQQSEAIGKMAGTVISALMAIKAAGMVGDKIGKMAQAKRLINKAEAKGNLPRAERIRNIVSPLTQHKTAIHTANTVLTGVAESGMIKGASKVTDALKVTKTQSGLKSTLVGGASHIKGHHESQSLKSAESSVSGRGDIPDDKIRKFESELHENGGLTPEQQKKLEIQKINEALIPELKQEFKDYPGIGDILEKYILDEAHPMDIVKYLQNSTTKAITIKSLKEVLELGKLDKVPPAEFEGVIRGINLERDSSFLKIQNFNRYEDLKTQLTQNNPDLYNIGDKIELPKGADLKTLDLTKLSLPYEQKKALIEYGKKLPEVNDKLNLLLENIAKELGVVGGFPSVSTRAKSPGGLLEKINRMRESNAGREKRPDYKLGDIPDAVGGRLTVTDVNQLESVIEKIKNRFGEDNIFEIENFYSSDKKLKKPYRVVTLTVTVDSVPCEIQLSTLKSSLMADIDHNVIYKEIHKVGDDIKANLKHINAQTTIQEHSLIK